MAAQGGISGVAVGMATAGAFLLYVGIQGVPIRDGLRSITSGTLPSGERRPTAGIDAAERSIAGVGASPAAVAGGGTIEGGAHPKIAAAALAYKGVPYKLGGTSRKGIDCSGLVVRAFQDAYGVTPPRTTYTQVAWDKLRPISRDQMGPGDLCFWPRIGPPSHVAIAIGDGNIVHAPRPGRRVEVVPVKHGFTGGALPNVFRYTGPTK